MELNINADQLNPNTLHLVLIPILQEWNRKLGIKTDFGGDRKKGILNVLKHLQHKNIPLKDIPPSLRKYMEQNGFLANNGTAGEKPTVQAATKPHPRQEEFSDITHPAVEGDILSREFVDEAFTHIDQAIDTQETEGVKAQVDMGLWYWKLQTAFQGHKTLTVSGTKNPVTLKDLAETRGLTKKRGLTSIRRNAAVVGDLLDKHQQIPPKVMKRVLAVGKARFEVLSRFPERLAILTEGVPVGKELVPMEDLTVKEIAAVATEIHQRENPPPDKGFDPRKISRYLAPFTKVFPKLKKAELNPYDPDQVTEKQCRELEFYTKEIGEWHQFMVHMMNPKHHPTPAQTKAAKAKHKSR